MIQSCLTTRSRPLRPLQTSRQAASARGGSSKRAKIRSRNGLTLLEILLASAILAAALSVLAQQNSNGVQAALRSQLETEAAVHCQSLLNTLLAKDITEIDVKDQPIRSASRWKWSARVEPSEFEDLSRLSVMVYQEGPQRLISTFQLSRLIPGTRQKAVR